MKWKTPKPGDRRTRKIFAIVPHDCIDGKTRWLARIAVEEEYSIFYGQGYWNIRHACALTDLCHCAEVGCEEFSRRGVAAHIRWPPPPVSA